MKSADWPRGRTLPACRVQHSQKVQGPLLGTSGLFTTPVGFGHGHYFCCNLRVRGSVKFVICLCQKLYFSKELNSKSRFWQFHLEAVSLLFQSFLIFVCIESSIDLWKQNPLILIWCLNMNNKLLNR